MGKLYGIFITLLFIISILVNISLTKSLKVADEYTAVFQDREAEKTELIWELREEISRLRK